MQRVNGLSEVKTIATKKIIIEGEIVPKGRPRFTGTGGIKRAVTPQKTRAFERFVKIVARQQCKEAFEGPVRVKIVIYKAPPKSWSNIKKEKAISGQIAATAKPDIDNYGKSILDALNGIAWRDDSYIIELSQRKEYANKDGAVVYVYDEGHLDTAY